MNKYPLSLGAACALLLSACSAVSPHPDRGRNDSRETHHEQMHRQQQSGGARYECENGMDIRVEVIDADTVRLSVDGRSMVMKRAVSASGERYTGRRGGWHEKHGEAVFEYTGKNGGPVETRCSAVR